MFKEFDIKKVLNYDKEYVPKNKVLYDFSKLGKEIHQPHIYSYVLNSDGFRSIELDRNVEIVALGCSHTFGVGLPVEYSWVNQLSSMLSKDIVNLSRPGASIPYLIDIFYNFYYTEKINPKILLCNFPNFSRYRKYSLKNNFVSSEATVMGHKDLEQNLFHVIQSIEAIDILEIFCKKNNIKLFWTVWDYGFNETIMYEFLTKRYKNYNYDSEAYSFEKINSWVEVDSESNVQIHLQPEHINNQTILHCHENEKKIYKDLFYTALDRYDLPKKYQGYYGQEDLSIEEINSLKKYISKNKSGSIHGAHHGWHRQHHWALFFYDLIKSLV
jgi:hypothetical protein